MTARIEARHQIRFEVPLFTRQYYHLIEKNKKEWSGSVVVAQFEVPIVKFYFRKTAVLLPLKEEVSAWSDKLMERV